MSSNEKTVQYTALDVGDKVQEGDQWLDEHGQWQSYVFLSGWNGVVGYGVRARRPIAATQPVTYEEVPGSRTTQQAIDQPQRERIAYEELQPATEVQAGDQYRNTQGRWVEYSIDTSGVPIVGPTALARRPHNITALQKECDEFQTALIESRLSLKRKVAEIMEVCEERDEACRERDLARSEVARLSTELWARKPLEERVTSLTDELAQAREASQQLLQTITDNADQFAWANKTLEQQRDEARAERDRLQEVVGNLYNEPTAKQVQDMLRTWATELDWSAGCFDSVGRDEIDTIQKTLVAVIERIEHTINPEGDVDDN